MRIGYVVLAASAMLARAVHAEGSWRLSPLGTPPDWDAVRAHAGAVDRAKVEALLAGRVAPGGSATGWVEVRDEGLEVVLRADAPAERMVLAWDPDPVNDPGAKPARAWRSRDDLPPRDPARPLAGVRIAIDPGHLGGRWAEREERSWNTGFERPVREGDLALDTAAHLRDLLAGAGAEVFLTRADDTPAAGPDPETWAAETGLTTMLPAMRDRLFLTAAEIRARAEVLRAEFGPDLTVCLHYDAVPWADPLAPALVPRDHTHVLVFGAVGAGEWARDDVRAEALLRVLDGSASEEAEAARAVAAALLEDLGRPAFQYRGPQAAAVDAPLGVWARNLLANRLFQGPVIYVEAVVANSTRSGPWLAAGDYDGERDFGEGPVRSAPRVVAGAVARGILRHFAAESSTRLPTP